VSADPARSQDPAQAAFVERLVDAINSKSTDRRKALLHPKSLVCATAESNSFYSEMTSRQARQTIPPGYKWKITPIPANQGPMFADKFDYPIRPTHLLQLDVSTSPTSSTSIILQIIFDAKQWREVTACPKPDTIAAAKAAEQLRMEQAKRVEMLVANISPELRQTVVKLVKEGQKVGAIKHYAEVSGENLSTAKDVVERLAAQAP
jgi:ribosomal protein L7/L12